MKLFDFLFSYYYMLSHLVIVGALKILVEFGMSSYHRAWSIIKRKIAELKRDNGVDGNGCYCRVFTRMKYSFNPSYPYAFPCCVLLRQLPLLGRCHRFAAAECELHIFFTRVVSIASTPPAYTPCRALRVQACSLRKSDYHIAPVPTRMQELSSGLNTHTITQRWSQGFIFAMHSQSDNFVICNRAILTWGSKTLLRVMFVKPT